MAVAMRPELLVDDPMLSRKDAAKYLGVSGKTLDRLKIERAPMPGTGVIRFGYRRSTLNAHLASLKSPKGRAHTRRTA